MAEEGKLHKEAPALFEFTAATTYAAGEVIQLADGRLGIMVGLKAMISGDKVAASVRGVFDLASASAKTFSVGDDVYWDVSANAAVNNALTLEGASNFYAGVCVRAKTSGQLVVRTMINVKPLAGAKQIVFEFDCATATATSGSKVLIPAEQNPTGLIINEIFALITEAMVGDSQDQGVVTVSDESDNALAVLTPSDSGTDSIGDIIVGYQRQQASSDDALKLVAAGEFIDAAVTQECVGTGTPAGKMKVYVVTTPLL